MKGIYGFKIADITGGSITRWFNSNTKSVYPMVSDLNRINLAQDVQPFRDAYWYSKDAAKRMGLEFYTLKEEDWKKIDSPIKKFFKSLKRKK